jgi:formylglycine-generating enzyme required for sulfatase activity
VRITRGFLVGQHEVTQSQYQQVTGKNPSYFSAQGQYKERVSGLDTSQFPVENVSWFECVDFANRLSQREGRPPYYRISGEQRTEDRLTAATVAIAGGEGYRLLTEAEWEYVARAGTSTIFPWGGSLSSEQANFDGNYPYGGAAKGKYLERPTPVGSYAPNPWGLYDTAGNVYEWVWDWYGADEYKQYAGKAAEDPQGPTAGGGVYRVLRGGSWDFNGRYCRPAYRYWSVPGYGRSGAGFRLALGRSGERAP